MTGFQIARQRFSGLGDLDNILVVLSELRGLEALLEIEGEEELSKSHSD